jgi:CelD/BcsL family acetyltransferase involved in cellulose biosynthesis
LARDFASRGWLQLSCLELDREIIGMFYDFCYGNKIYYYQGGFDSSKGQYSVGLALRAYTIRKAIDGGLKEIDLLRGAYDHKYRWTPLDRRTVNLIMGKNNLASKLFFFKIIKQPRFKVKIKKFLPNYLVRIIRRRKEFKNSVNS